jgi:hypothetical protein
MKPTPVFRVVRTSTPDDRAALAAELTSEREKGAVPTSKREKKVPEVLDALCVDETLCWARRRWGNMHKAACREGGSEPERGCNIVELVLTEGQGFLLEDRKDRQGKLLVWGEPTKLAAAARRVVRADSEED